MLLWTWLYEHQLNFLHSILLVLFPELEFLDCMVILWLYFLRKFCTICYSGYTILHSCQQCRKIPISPHSHQNLLISIFLILILKAVFYCGFNLHVPKFNDVEHLFTCLLAICISSLGNICSSPLSIFFFLCPFLNQMILLLISCGSPLYILNINLLSDK